MKNFIRTLISNVNKEYYSNKYDLIFVNEQYSKIKNIGFNEYEKSVANIYPESKAKSIFSGIVDYFQKIYALISKKKLIIILTIFLLNK